MKAAKNALNIILAIFNSFWFNIKKYHQLQFLRSRVSRIIFDITLMFFRLSYNYFEAAYIIQ